ncbi:MAG: segregation/condensation protein A [Candidatus Firestonebacteria bacterium]|nr:segregation/condensation protein A [Candidatus Firestonebacteria bacterium]
MTYKIDLENFEGPFDLLLFLIKKEEMDIYDIPIARITDQYLEYIESVKIVDLNNAGEFLLMSATLMYIKSRMLLPIEKVSIDEELNTDPRDELIQRLLEYKKYKEAAHLLKHKEIEQDNYYQCKISLSNENATQNTDFEASLFDLVRAFNQIYTKINSQEKFYEINRIIYKVEDKIEFIQELLNQNNDINFTTIFDNCSSKLEIVVTFLAILELIKRKEIAAWQSKLFGEIWITKKG